MTSHLHKAAIILIAFACLVPAAHAAKTLNNPPPSQWGCELPEDKVLQGITTGLMQRGWRVISNDGNGNLVARVVVRGKHTLVVDISYDQTTYDVNYKSSDNLKYKLQRDGTATIHRNANSWMNNIYDDIGLQLTALCKR